MNVQTTPTQYTPQTLLPDRVRQDALWIFSGGTAGKIGGTETALLSAVAIVIILGAIQPTRKYAAIAGGVIVLLWARKFYKQFVKGQS